PQGFRSGDGLVDPAGDGDMRTDGHRLSFGAPSGNLLRTPRKSKEAIVRPTNRRGMPPSLLCAADALLLGVASAWGTAFPGRLSARQAVGAAAILGGVVMGEVARREGWEGAWT